MTQLSVCSRCVCVCSRPGCLLQMRLSALDLSVCSKPVCVLEMCLCAPGQYVCCRPVRVLPACLSAPDMCACVCVCLLQACLSAADLSVLQTCPSTPDLFVCSRPVCVLQTCLCDSELSVGLKCVFRLQSCLVAGVLRELLGHVNLKRLTGDINRRLPPSALNTLPLLLPLRRSLSLFISTSLPLTVSL